MTGLELKQWRQERDLTREKLAALLNNMNLRTLEAWEQDKNPIPAHLTLALETLERRLKKRKR